VWSEIKMNSKKLIIIIVVILVIVLGGWLLVKNQKMPVQNPPTTSTLTPKTNNNQDTKTYTNTEYGFEFEYPAEWTMHENIFGGPNSKFNLTGASPKENGIPNPVISSFLVNIVTPTFAKNAFGGIDGVNITVSGISGKKYELEFNGIKEIGIDLPFGQYHMLLGATKEYETVFNQILASFKFLK